MELEKINFKLGNEKKVAEFLSGLKAEDKIMILSHTDLDGLASARIANEVLDADIVKFVDYTDLNEDLVLEIKEMGVNKLFISDLYFKEPEVFSKFEEFSEILYIDHHQITKDYNSEKTVFMNAENYCATYLIYYLFFRAKNLENLDWLVACASISDWMYFENKAWMSYVFEKYGEKFEFEEEVIKKSGKFWDTQWKLNLAIIYFKKDLKKVFNSLQYDFDCGDLLDYAEEVQKEIDFILEDFEKNKEEINERLFYEFTPKFRIGSIVSSTLSGRYTTKSVIIARNEGDTFNFSARRGDSGENMNLLLQKLTESIGTGGGHVPAGGGHVRMEHKEEFLKRLRNLKEVVK